MAYTLQAKNIKLEIDHPLENYQGSRFDYTGKIVSVKFKNLEICGVERNNPTNQNNLGRGFYNEFGMQSPIGYNETKAGEWFHKIGIGLLQKDDEPYSFLKNYPVKPAAFEVQEKSSKLVILCVGEIINGYGYHLQKEIEVFENGFAITYHLQNTGSKTINTNEYNHNFLGLNGSGIDENLEVEFSFSPNSDDFFEFIDPENLIAIKENRIKLTSSPTQDFFLGEINGKKKVAPTWRLKHRKLKVEISETGDFKPQKMNLWGCQHVISPEIFFEINLAGNQAISWKRKYNFLSLK